MTRTHEVKLDGYGAHTTLADDRPVMLLGTAESYGIEMLHIVPGKDWEGLTITATFNASDGSSTDILMDPDGNVVVPSEATAKSGIGKVVFTGVSDGIQRISCDLEYWVVAHSAVQGAQSGGVAPSWFEQAANRFMPLGGTTGQVLTKKTDADFDAEWQDSKGGEGGGGATDHSKLENRDTADQHPISAITGLEEALDGKQAAGNYLTDKDLDTTLTMEGKAADAAVVGARLDSLSEKKVSLPKAEDGSIILGTSGWYAVSDGVGGITWIESAPSTGDETTHGIVWNLVNVTSSNNAVSVADGASLVAVLTPADGYTLGDVTITMGGEVVTGAWNADTATVTIQSVTGEVMISCAGVAHSFTETELDVPFYNVASFTGATGEFVWPSSHPVQTGTLRMANNDLIDCTDGTNLKMQLASSDDFSSTGVACRCFLYSDTAGTLAGSANPNGEIYTNDAWGSPNLFADTEYLFKTAGYYVRFVMGREKGFTSNANWSTYLNGEGNVYIAKVAASTGGGSPETANGDTTVSMASFDRVYTDTGEYTEGLQPKWDGMFSIHRGYSTAPNNTLQAIWEAKKHGYNCCELDVRYTSDNQVVLSHDANVTGTVDGVEVTYTIANTPLATLQTVCIGNTAFPDAKVCSLEDAMRLCRRIGMRPEIDYKVSNEQLYKDCVALSMKYGLQDDTLHCCYGINYAVIVKTAYKKANLRVDGSLLDGNATLDEYLTKPGNIYAFYAATACGKTDGSNVGANVDNETRILSHKAKGYKMYVWNVTPNLLPDVMQWEPDIIQPQSAKDKSDWYTLIRELNSFDGLIW